MYNDPTLARDIPLDNNPCYRASDGHAYHVDSTCFKAQANTLKEKDGKRKYARPAVRNGRFRATKHPVYKDPYKDSIYLNDLVVNQIEIRNNTKLPLVVTDISNFSRYVPTSRIGTDDTVVITRRFTRPLMATSDDRGVVSATEIFNPFQDSLSTKYSNALLDAIRDAKNYTDEESRKINESLGYRTTSPAVSAKCKLQQRNQLYWLQVEEIFSMDDFRHAPDGKSIYVPSIDCLLTLSDNESSITAPYTHPRHRQLSETIQFTEKDFAPGIDYVTLDESNKEYRMEFSLEICDPNMTTGNLYMYLFDRVIGVPVRRAMDGRGIGAYATTRYIDEAGDGKTLKEVVETLTISEAIDKYHLKSTAVQAKQWFDEGGMRLEAKLKIERELSDLKLEMTKREAELKQSIIEREAELKQSIIEREAAIKEQLALRVHQNELERDREKLRSDLEHEKLKNKTSMLSKITTAAVTALATVAVGAAVAVLKKAANIGSALFGIGRSLFSIFA